MLLSASQLATAALLYLQVKWAVSNHYYYLHDNHDHNHGNVGNYCILLGQSMMPDIPIMPVQCVTKNTGTIKKMEKSQDRDVILWIMHTRLIVMNNQ